MTSGILKRFTAVMPAIMLATLLAMPAAWAGKLLDEMQVEDNCGTTYADKLASCTPFRCTKPSPMAMMFGFPSDEALKKMPPERQQKMRASMAEAEKKMEGMSEEKRAAMKARMTSILEIKGPDAQGRCQTTTMAIPGQQMDCLFDKALLAKVADYTRLAATAEHIQVKSTSSVVNGKMVTEQIDTIDGKEMTNPWTAALNDGQCRMLKEDADLGAVSMDEMNRMSHFEFNLLERGKHVDGHIQILNSAGGDILFDKDVKTSLKAREINLKPGTFDIKVVSMNPQLAPVWFRGVKLGEANVFRKNIEFYAISGTLKLTVRLNGKKSNFGVYMTDPETRKWIYKSPMGNKPVFQFSPASITLPESLSGRYDVFVATVPERSFNVPDDAKYQQFQLNIKNGETVEKTIDFGQAPVGAAVNKKDSPEPAAATHRSSSMEQDTDRPGGGDLRNIVIAGNDPAVCQKACRDDGRCKAWTYVKPNMGQGPQGNCWLKADVPASVKNSCCVSGVK
ncbi:MAG TPA: PAN domain-containing protein [Mariprofundaceae bacterium]|nr:PAN domain-containing protein [Mariprofundaceae bacterium]